MPFITIDGKEIEFNQGQTIMEAARAGGISIPHFCWHPSLSISGNCRVCLVEVEKMPKLVISCATLATEGMVVHTKSEKTIGARNAVMEFILINHPLDCPICDEAGECKLQNYAYKHSVGESRFVEEKNHKKKRTLLGPHVMFDGERCISCSRCIRFSAEIAKANQLTFVQRGDRVTIETFPGEEFDNPYTLNTVDICPVGALTSVDFRFKARVWEMSKSKSICVGCARGCNINIWTRDNEIQRLTPRRNDNVNDRWMCDNGRLNTFKFVNSDSRIEGGRIRKGERYEPLSRKEAVDFAAEKLAKYAGSEIAFIGSPFATTEDNYLLRRLAEHFNSENLFFAHHVIEGDGDDILIREDKTPNSKALEILGFKNDSQNNIISNLINNIKNKNIKVICSLDDDLTKLDENYIDTLKSLEFTAVVSSNENSLTGIADVVIGASTYAEKHGTFVNFQGRAQRIRPAVDTQSGDISIDGKETSRWEKFGTEFDRWAQGKRYDAVPGWKILSELIEKLGGEASYQFAGEVFDEITRNIDEFDGLSYEVIGDEGAQLESYKEIHAETVK